MAQWAGGFSGNTHATRVADAEGALKQAITAFKSHPSIETAARAKVTRMAERLLSARERMLKARLVAIRDASAQDGAPPQAQLTDLQARLERLQDQGVAGILTEFGLPS